MAWKERSGAGDPRSDSGVAVIFWSPKVWHSTCGFPKKGGGYPVFLCTFQIRCRLSGDSGCDMARLAAYLRTFSMRFFSTVEVWNGWEGHLYSLCARGG